MGQKEISSSLKKVTILSKQLFSFKAQIGSGGYSKVYKAYYPKIYHPLAVKEMSKHQIFSKNISDSVLSEKHILSSLFHPFIINLYASFQDQDNLYLVMDYCPCGDLRYQMSFNKTYSEEQLRFVAACIILGLEYIHSKGIIHRDIKPENIICDEKGFYRISDFGIACKEHDIQNEYELVGTPGYMSPEAVRGKHIGYESDYFSLGVILYEMMFYELPFKEKEKEEMLNEFENEVIINYEETEYSKELCDFVNGLLKVDNMKRLGKDGIRYLKKHVFLKDFNWEELFLKNKMAPIIPRQYKNKRKQLNSFRNKDDLLSLKDTSDTDHLSNTNKYENIFNEFNFLRKINNKTYHRVYNSNNTNLINDKSTILNKMTSSLLTPLKQNGKKYYSKSPRIKLFANSILPNVVNSNNSLQKHNSSSCLSKYSIKLPIINSYHSKVIPNNNVNYKIKASNRSVLSKNFLVQSSIEEEKGKMYLNEMMINRYNNSKKGRINNYEQYLKFQNKSMSKCSLQNSINKTTLSSIMLD